MRILRCYPVAFFGFCIALECISVRAQISPNGGDRAQESRVEQLVREIIAADIAEDLDRVVSFYADDAILLTPGGPDIAGIDSIRRHYERLFAETDLQIENETMETIVSGNLAMTRGVNRVTTTPPGGGPTRPVTDKYIMILEKDDADSWRISRLMWAPLVE